MEKKHNLTIGKTYDIDGIHTGVYVKDDIEGNPLFDMGKDHHYSADDEGLISFGWFEGDTYEEVNHENS